MNGNNFMPTQPDEEWFDVVDEEDQVIGRETRAFVHRQGLRHRAVHLWIFHPNGRCLLQKRSMKKDRFPGCWTSAVSGHVNSGETYPEALEREIREEAGLCETLKTQLIATVRACDQTENEFIWLHAALHPGPFSPPQDEVEELRWFSVQEMHRLAQDPHGRWTPSLIYLWRNHGYAAIARLFNSKPARK